MHSFLIATSRTEGKVERSSCISWTIMFLPSVHGWCNAISFLLDFFGLFLFYAFMKQGKKQAAFLNNTEASMALLTFLSSWKKINTTPVESSWCFWVFFSGLLSRSPAHQTQKFLADYVVKLHQHDIRPFEI